jgi:hypothetical protein
MACGGTTEVVPRRSKTGYRLLTTGQRRKSQRRTWGTNLHTASDRLLTGKFVIFIPGTMSTPL